LKGSALVLFAVTANYYWLQALVLKIPASAKCAVKYRPCRWNAGYLATLLIELDINDSLWTVTGCLCPTPTDNLPVLAGIQPGELCRKGATPYPPRRAMEPGDLLISAHLSTVWECTASRHLIHLYSPHSNTWVHLRTTTEVRRSGRFTNGVCSGWRTLRDSILLSPTSAPTLV